MVEEVVGFDLGHGESAVAWVSLRSHDRPKIVPVNGPRTQITAIGVQPDVGVVIGARALRSRYVTHRQVGFKMPPPGTEESRRALVAFARQYDIILTTNRQILGGDRTHYFVGCPSGWTAKQADEYAELLRSALTTVSVVRESRAALIQAKEAGHLSAAQLRGSILVLDAGSSTIDVSFISGGIQDESLDLGVELGAHLIEREMLRRAVQRNARREEIETFFATAAGIEERSICEVECRRLKETYWNEATGDAGERFPLNYPLPSVGIALDVFLDGSEMEAILTASLPELCGASWRDSFAALLESIKTTLAARSVMPNALVLTGGASHMPFIRDLYRGAFPLAEPVWCTPPEETVALGLARWGSIQLQTTAFSNAVARFCRTELPTIVERHEQPLRRALATELTSGIIADIVTPAIREWREGGMTTLDALSQEILQRTATWIMSTRGTAAIERVYAPIRDAISREVNARTSEICDEHDIPRSSLFLTVNLSVASPNTIAHMGTPFDAVLGAIQAVTAIITLAFLAIAKGGLATATLTTPPPLWPVIGMIIGIAAVAGVVSLEEVVRSKMIPIPVRRAFLTEGRLVKLIGDARPKMHDQFAEALGPKEMLAVRNAITDQVSNFLTQRANEVKWIIA